MAALLLNYRTAGTGLAQEGKNTLAGLVGLGQHGGAGLGQDVCLGELDHFLSHVDVGDAGLSGLQVFTGNVQRLDGVLETVLRGTQVRTGGRDVLDRLIDVFDGRLRRSRIGDRETSRSGANRSTDKGYDVG